MQRLMNLLFRVISWGQVELFDITLGEGHDYTYTINDLEYSHLFLIILGGLVWFGIYKVAERMMNALIWRN